MDPNIDFGTVWNQIIDECLDENTEEELISSIRERQLEANNTIRRRQRRTMIDYSREEGHNLLFIDYFSKNPIYTEAQFRRRFRMQRHVFFQIVKVLGNHDEYFQIRVDAVRRISHSPLQKCTATIHLLSYGVLADCVDDYVGIGENTVVECLERFITGVCEVFGETYLRRLNNEDNECILQMGEAYGFPVAWKGQFSRGDHAKPTIMLEAVASQDLWIWHAFFGTLCSNNDINMLNASNGFSDILERQAPTVQFTVNRTPYNMGYYPADDIYREWATFVYTISMPHGEKRKLFGQRQESARKDVERAFGVLQSRFATVCGLTLA